MRDHDRRPSAHEPVEGLLHQILALVVERARGLVEQEDACVAQDRARDGDPLALPDRETHATLAHDRVPPLRESRDELRRVRGLGGSLDLGIGRLEAPVADVLADRVCEEDRLLRDHSDLLAQRADRHLPDIPAVHADLPSDRIVEAADEVHEGRLPRPRRADERGGLAIAELRRQAFEHEGTVRVAEGDVVEFDVALDAADRRSARQIPDLGLGVEEREDPVGGAEGLLDLRPLPGETAHGPRDHPHVQEERHELARRELAARDLVAAVPEDDDR